MVRGGSEEQPCMHGIAPGHHHALHGCGWAPHEEDVSQGTCKGHREGGTWQSCIQLYLLHRLWPGVAQPHCVLRWQLCGGGEAPGHQDEGQAGDAR
eukprot:671651-Amphidinium_carterae.4